MKTTVRIDTRSMYACGKYYSRELWQRIFDYYCENGGNLRRMDNLLIDAKVFEDAFLKYKDETLYWYGDCAGITRITDICEDEYTTYDLRAKITISWGEKGESTYIDIEFINFVKDK